MSTKSIVAHYEDALASLVEVKALLEVRKSVQDARVDAIAEALDEAEEDDRHDSLTELHERAEEIAGAIDDRVNAITDQVDMIQGEIETLQAEKARRAKKLLPKVTKYMIRKRNRPTDTYPYSGNSCARGNVKPGLYYDTKEEAQADADKLNAVNSKGFDVVEVLR